MTKIWGRDEGKNITGWLKNAKQHGAFTKGPPVFLFASAAVGFDLAASDLVFSCLALLPTELSSLAPPPPQTSSYLNLKMANSTLKNILKRY